MAFAHAFGPTVRVNAVQPGTFLTDVSKAWDAEAFAAGPYGLGIHMRVVREAAGSNADMEAQERTTGSRHSPPTTCSAPPRSSSWSSASTCTS